MGRDNSTQGDSVSMPLKTSSVQHVAFADGLSCAGKLLYFRQWWDNNRNHGSLLGYNPRGDKYWLIVKSHLHMELQKREKANVIMYDH